MLSPHMPNIRVLSTPVANIILLKSIGSRLRSHYEDLLYYPVSDEIDVLLRKLA
jgi:hypothetical protein